MGELKTLDIGVEEHSVFASLFQLMSVQALDLAVLKWKEKPNMMVQQKDW